MKKLLLITLIGLPFMATGQGTIPEGETNDFDFWTKYSPELIFRFEGHRYEIRYRPMEIVYPLEGTRQDLMIGYRFQNAPFRIFNYAKFDTRGRIWNGVRLDYTPRFAQHGRAMVQARYFQGLVDAARNQVYLVNFAMYPIDLKQAQATGQNPDWYTGLFSFGRYQFKGYTDGDYFGFVGPMLYWTPDEIWGLLAAATWDVIGTNELYCLLRMQVRLTWPQAH
ncbi:MAG: hypothetical protein AAFQ98_08225 [Bacteroidota bacterium]